MGLIEQDPRDIAYMALFTAIEWYCEISSDVAIRLAKGQSHRLPGRKLTPETFAEMQKTINSPNFYNIDSLVKKYRVSKYEILEAIGGTNANMEVIFMPKIEAELKRIRKKAEDCPAANCEKCNLNATAYGDTTLCELLCDMQFDSAGNLVIGENKGVRKSAIKCDFAGETIKRGFQLYESVDGELNKYMARHKDKKVREVINTALVKFLEKNT
jgi:hypothetical protein